MAIYKLTRAELKTKRAKDYKDGDLISVGPYFIHIRYHSRDKQRTYDYDSPSLCSWHERKDGLGYCDCTPGEGRPYYIDDFINR